MVSGGFSLDDIRLNMTLKDFKTYLLITTKRKIDDQRAQSILLLMTLGSMISKKVGEQAKKVSETSAAQSDDLEYELQLLHGLIDAEGIVNTTEVGTRQNRSTRKPQTKEEKQQKVMRLLQILDIGMAKVTGKPTGAPWAVANSSNLETTSTNDLVSQVNSNRMPVGPRG